MKKLINASRIPYGGMYVLNVPEKGIVGHGMNFPALLRSITEWRRANSIPVGLGFEEEVERTVCEKYPAECENPIIIRRVQSRGGRLRFSTILRGTQALLSFKLAGSPLVSQEVAESRAAICAPCRYNQEFSQPCGGGCASLKSAVLAIVGGNTTPYDAQLKSCGICGCVAAAHIWLPNEILAKGVTDAMREEFATVENCWKRSV